MKDFINKGVDFYDDVNLTHRISKYVKHYSDERYYIIKTHWNKKYVDALYDGCYSTLRASGVSNDQIHVITVGGSYEVC